MKRRLGFARVGGGRELEIGIGLSCGIGVSNGHIRLILSASKCVDKWAVR